MGKIPHQSLQWTVTNLLKLNKRNFLKFDNEYEVKIRCMCIDNAVLQKTNPKNLKFCLGEVSFRLIFLNYVFDL